MLLIQEERQFGWVKTEQKCSPGLERMNILGKKKNLVILAVAFVFSALRKTTISNIIDKNIRPVTLGFYVRIEAHLQQ